MAATNIEMRVRLISILSITFALATVMTAVPVNSAIVYSGKLFIQGPVFNIDLNNDGRNDFDLTITRWAGGNGFSQNGIDIGMNHCMRFINTYLDPALFGDRFPGTKAPLEYGTLISATAPNGRLWASISNDAMMWTEYNMLTTTYSGEWHNIDKYLGFELTVDSNRFYGWAHLSTDSYNNIKLIDYAYENVPDTAILAGAASVPIPSALLLVASSFVGLTMIQRKRSH